MIESNIIIDKSNPKWGTYEFKGGDVWSVYRNNNNWWTAINPLKAQPSKTKSDIIVAKE